MKLKFNRKAFLKEFPPEEFDYSQGHKKLIEYIVDVEWIAYQAGYDLKEKELSKTKRSGL